MVQLFGAVGGTPAYQYELRQANGTTVVTAFNNNPDLQMYRQLHGFVHCTNATGVPVTVNAPPTLTATLDATTDYCYTVQIQRLVVNVAGGGPFTYALDGNAAISSASTTFSLLIAPETYHSCNRQQQLYAIHYSEHRYSTCSSIQRH
jgi:hypothetical protein